MSLGPRARVQARDGAGPRAVARPAPALLLIAACGSGTLDPFAPVGPSAPTPENCAAIDRDTSRSSIPAALRPLTRTAQRTTSGDFAIDWLEYPLLYRDANQWSIWGKGLLASNGRYYSAVGDNDRRDDGSPHDGNSFLYEYDPGTRTIRAVGDAQSAFGAHVAGENGYGQVHARISEGPCGLLYTHTYWGSPLAALYTEAYRGDLLLRYNPWSQALESLGVKVPRTGTPSTNLWRPGGLFFGEANPPSSGESIFWAFDLRNNRLVYQSPARPRLRVGDSTGGNRNIAVDKQGRAYHSDGGPGLFRYSPATNRDERLSVSFSGPGWLRASTAPAADGTIIMVTREPTEIYRFDPSRETLTKLGATSDYIADLELAPSEKVAYYVPGGVSATTASTAPFTLREINLTTGAVRTLADLAPPVESAGGTRPVWSYSLIVSPDGHSLYVAANGGPKGYGVPLLLTVHLPPSALP